MFRVDSLATSRAQNGAQSVPVRVRARWTKIPPPLLVALLERVTPLFSRHCAQLARSFSQERKLTPAFSWACARFRRIGGCAEKKSEGPDSTRLVSRLAAQAVAFLAFFLIFSVTVARSEKVEQLSPQGYVNDFAGVVDADSRAKLTALLPRARPEGQRADRRRHHSHARG